MTVPEFQSFFFPILEFASDQKEHSLNEVRDYLTEHFQLTDEAKSERVPSGTQTKFDNRIYWTKSYFGKAKLIKNTKRAHFRITELGIKFLNKFSSNLTIKDLKTIDEFREFREGANSEEKTETTTTIVTPELKEETQTPLEQLEETFQFIQNELASELLEKIRINSWHFFEDLVVDLMIKVGYGGSKSKAGQSIQRTNDEGIDGIINEDKLGLYVIYLQAKMWQTETTISRPEVQKFVGALHGKRAKKGVFITTSSFTKGAIEYVKKIDPKVILIDGQALTNLMIEHNVGTNDACIPIRMEHIRKYPKLFPALQPDPESRKGTLKEVIEFVWDDGVIMQGRLEGSQPLPNSGIKLPKQIASFPHKDELGIYIRERLNIPLGKRVLREDLVKYGRDTISVSVIEEGVYYLDFSV